MPQPTDLYVRTRRALLDALEALESHHAALVLVGAHAIYLHTGEVDEAIATETKDSDLVIDPALLDDDPRLEQALTAAGFHRELNDPQPGSWLSTDGIPVDLLIPETVAPGKGTRSVELSPHDPHSTRRVTGLEGALIDRDIHRVNALDPDDLRAFEIAVAGPAALLIAKLQKITERQAGAESRRIPKDSHDVYRLLREVPTGEIVVRYERLLAEPLTSPFARSSVTQLQNLFGSPAAPGSQMAGRTVGLLGDPEQVAVASELLVRELLDALRGELSLRPE